MTISPVPALFQPLRVGNLDLKHRVVLAPLTRLRNDANHVPGPQAATYYSQRASTPGTLLISEGTAIAPRAGGWPHLPGIWSDAHIAAWKEVTTAVHAKGSYIFCQIAAIGRAAHAKALQEQGYDVVSSSDLPYTDESGAVTIPRYLTVDEIQEYPRLFAQAAENAIAAGFDGIELHGANGYFIDQFLQDTVNNRTDEYGGSVESRARLPLEIVDAVSKAIGSSRVGFRMSPWVDIQDMGMKDPVPTFSYLACQLKKRSIAYIHVIEPRPHLFSPEDGDKSKWDPNVTNISNDFLRKIWADLPYITADGNTRESALRDAEAKGGLYAFGRLYISNPDLPRRLKDDLPLTLPDRSKFYMAGNMTAEGYTDWPFASET
ncbi:NADH:flavin oxidoreductase/NADH oxidase [Coniophora puteana RWD-64-598 SS2]|uniref:NADH:flavin oxidoreductase/NADH oxidase n=1 Tax=Coniophora puteana (strain RWD-64-598) TaxID=741705 RepID=A0A5M3MDQ4_CONPW|nr:NADH:flavin oxidoreductase/NADH oxidase [Coniophora puteana RWD-64-598 SS2]EIW76974.1 NADH:flavin oxidoreductase/NADH oxidase [Coniophora puteana RWD-64-598 SS2]